MILFFSLCVFFSICNFFFFKMSELTGAFHSNATLSANDGIKNELYNVEVNI